MGCRPAGEIKPGGMELIQGRFARAQALHGAATTLVLEPTLARSGCRAGWPSGHRSRCCLVDKRDKPIERILPVTLLGTVFLCRDDQHAIAGHSSSGQSLKALLNILWYGSRMAYVEAKLHRGRDLVDVLTTGPRRANENFLDVTLVDGDGWTDTDHGRIVARTAKPIFFEQDP